MTEVDDKQGKQEKTKKQGTEMRLNKFLSDAGVCSRREADAWIEKGLVFVDGQPAKMGMRISPNQQIVVNGKSVVREEEFILLAVNKPIGVVCTTTSKFQEENIVDMVHFPKRIYPVGRLDKNSEGLILMTNKGEIVNQILKGSNYHEKEYIVSVNKPITKEFLDKISSGVPILDTITRPCTIKQMGEKRFSIILTQGLNRQIRRMCEYCGYRVRKLKRVRVLNIQLGDLKSGEYRQVSKKELEVLKRMLAESAKK